MSEPLTWRVLDWQRPLDPARVADVLRHWAADARSPRLIVETRFTRGNVLSLLGSPRSAAVVTPLKALPNATLRRFESERQAVSAAGRINAGSRHRPLRLHDPEALTRALFAVGLRVRANELLVLQLVLGPRRIPMAVPNASPASTVQPWWSAAWLGDGGQLDGERRAALRTKVADHGFACTLRLGVRTADPRDRARARSLLLGLFAALRVTEAPGLHLRLRHDHPRRLNAATAPLRWPLRLGVPELVPLTGWPLGELPLPGMAAIHPRRLAPPKGTTGTERVFADATAPAATSKDQQLALPIGQALHHLHVLGPTGVGKSTLLASLIAQDLAAGYNVVVIEPKGDLVTDVLARAPKQRLDDIAVLDPTDDTPVGLNPLTSRGGQRRPDLLADSLLAVFKQLYGKNIGPRSSDILYAGLLTLARRDDASLVMLPLLLTNPGFRRSLTTGLRDPLVLEPFWASFERWSDAERANAVEPVLNKLRPLLRPGLRAVLGQRQPRFDISSVFTGSACLFVPLRRGVIGSEASKLLGSMVVAELWNAIQGRAALPASQRRPVVIYLDEAQDVISGVGVDLAEALAQARGYGAAFVLANQFLGQFPRDMRAAVLANARSRIVFQLAHDDARIMERGHPELSAADLTGLGRYELYASLYASGTVQPYASGRSRPLPRATTSVGAVLARSRRNYGQPLDEVEAGFADLLNDSDSAPTAPTGRRRRQP